MKTFAVTRPKGEGDDTARFIQGLGWTPLIFHTVELKPRPRSVVFAEIEDSTVPAPPDWFVFMSPRGVDLFFQVLETSRSPMTSLLEHSQVLAVGPETRSALSRQGIKKLYTPDRYSSEGVSDFLIRLALKGKRIILLRSQQADNSLVTKVREAGAMVTTIPLYESAIPLDSDSVWSFITRLRSGRVDATLFTSALSTVNLFEMCRSWSPPEDPLRLLGNTLVGAIGPTTAAQLRELGVEPGFRPESFTIECAVTGLVNAVERVTPPARLIRAFS